MKQITERDLIRDVYNAFEKQFSNSENKEIAAILKKLAALDLEKASPEDIERIFGNQSWTKLQCDECERYVKAVVQVGEKPDPDYESSTARLCLDCVRKAYALASGGTTEEQP